MNEVVVIIANGFILIPVILALIVAYQLPNNNVRLRYGATLVLGGILALLLTHFSGYFINDPRPFVVGHFVPLIPHAIDNGFPSDHTLFVSLLGWGTLKYSKKYGVVILGLAILIGIARVMAGVHHLQDILGALVISGIAILITLLITKIIVSKRTALSHVTKV